MPNNPRQNGDGSRILIKVSIAAGIATVVIAATAVIGLLHGSSNGSSGASPLSSTPRVSATSHATPSVSVPDTPTATVSPSASASPQRQYVSVPLGVLCNANGAVQNLNALYGCQVDNGTTPIGSRLFSWAARPWAGTSEGTFFSFPKTTCRRLNLRFGINRGQYVPAGLRITVSVIQHSGQQQASVVFDHLESLTVKLDGGPWDIDAIANISGSWDIVINGYASCSTSSGV
jgi:hypothetical protein